jgi:hypothetical protein
LGVPTPETPPALLRGNGIPPKLFRQKQKTKFMKVRVLKSVKHEKFQQFLNHGLLTDDIFIIGLVWFKTTKQVKENEEVELPQSMKIAEKTTSKGRTIKVLTM